MDDAAEVKKERARAQDATDEEEERATGSPSHPRKQRWNGGRGGERAARSIHRASRTGDLLGRYVRSVGPARSPPCLNVPPSTASRGSRLVASHVAGPVASHTNAEQVGAPPLL